MVPTHRRSDKRTHHVSVRMPDAIRPDQAAEQSGRVVPLHHLVDRVLREAVSAQPPCEHDPRTVTSPQASEPDADQLPNEPDDPQADRDPDEDAHDQFQSSSPERDDLVKSPMFMFNPLLPRSSRRLST